MDFSKYTIAEIKTMLDQAGASERARLVSRLGNDPRQGVQRIVTSYHNEIKRFEAEDMRQKELSKYERAIHKQGFTLVAGADEAGRGALAGPIVAAAVILPKNAKIHGLRDSKLLSAEQREDLYGKIVNVAAAWKAARIEHHQIDAHGIQWANLQSLERAILGLEPGPDYVLLDAFDIKTLEIPHLAIVKGDRLSLSIAAASVIAKVTRDRIMREYHKDYPAYGFDRHKGYGTQPHIRALEECGISPIHRTCFMPVAGYEQLGLM